MSTSAGCNTSIFLLFIFINLPVLRLFYHTGKTGRCNGFQKLYFRREPSYPIFSENDLSNQSGQFSIIACALFYIC